MTLKPFSVAKRDIMQIIAETATYLAIEEVPNVPRDLESDLDDYRPLFTDNNLKSVLDKALFKCYVMIGQVISCCIPSCYGLADDFHFDEKVQRLSFSDG